MQTKRETNKIGSSQEEAPVGMDQTPEIPTETAIPEPKKCRALRRLESDLGPKWSCTDHKEDPNISRRRLRVRTTNIYDDRSNFNCRNTKNWIDLGEDYDDDGRPLELEARIAKEFWKNNKLNT